MSEEKKNNLMIIRKNSNSISLELQNNDDGKIIDQILQTHTLNDYYEDEQFKNKTTRFFERYCDYSIMTFYKEKRSIELFIKLLESLNKESLSGIIIEKDNSIFVRFADISFTRMTVISSTTKQSQNLVYYFKELSNNLGNLGVIKCKE